MILKVLPLLMAIDMVSSASATKVYKGDTTSSTPQKRRRNDSNLRKKRFLKDGDDDTCAFDIANGGTSTLPQGPNGEFVGCVEKSDKNCGEKLRFLPDGDACDAEKEIEVKWNQMGPMGPTGPAGADGVGCTATPDAGGATISCGTGAGASTVQLTNGSNGQDGKCFFFFLVLLTYNAIHFNLYHQHHHLLIHYNRYKL